MPHEGSKAKCALDRVRALLGTPTVGPACLMCGAALPCQLCDGKQVRAANLIRALREVLRGQPVDGLGPQWGREDPDKTARQAGTFMATTLVFSSRRFNGHEGDR